MQQQNNQAWHFLRKRFKWLRRIRKKEKRLPPKAKGKKTKSSEEHSPIQRLFKDR